MARFTYTAEKNDGEKYSGAAEAADRFELYQIIRREGGRVLGVEEETSNRFINLKWWNSLFSRIGEYEKILFARNIGAMLGAGLPLARALAVIERQTKNQKMIDTVDSLASAVRRGDTFHAALEKFPSIFSKLFVAMVRAGEEGGDLPQSLTVIADQMDRMHSLKKKIRGALIYPAIIIIAIIIIGAIMMVVVVPTLASTFEEMEVTLPTSTQIIIGLSNFLAHHTFVAALLLVGFVVALWAAHRTVRGKRFTDAALLKVPLIGGVIREVNAARTSRTLASLLASGVDVLTALEIVREVLQNTYFQDVITEASKEVGQGQPLSATFTKNEHLYPAFVGEMMAVGEETGQTNEMLKRLASYYEEEVDRRTKDMSTVIEPFLMIIIGAAVGFFAVSMVTPIYQLSSAI